MDGVRKSIDGERERTDASLRAERAQSLGYTVDVRARRRFVDRIEHDRLVVDHQLFEFRGSADRLLAAARGAGPVADETVARERIAADHAMHDERGATDTILDDERRRSDKAVNDRDGTGAAAGGQTETDKSLSIERHRVDDTIVAFADAQRALSSSHDVLTMVAHEMNNPLAAMTLNGQLLAEGAHDTESRETAEDVVRLAARMKRLLMDLLDGARIDAGILRVTPKQHDVGPFLEAVRLSYEPLFASRHLTFTVDSVAPRLVALFDKDRIVQVLSNLLSNALKFTPAMGAVNLKASAHPDGVEFTVRDTGSGIASEALPHVFERFWQAGTESRVGIGLGLYICKNIIEAHGGQIAVESARGSGATFRFTLPSG